MLIRACPGSHLVIEADLYFVTPFTGNRTFDFETG